MRLALPDLLLKKFYRRRFIAARQRDFFNRFRFFQVRRVNLHATTLNIPQGFVNRNFELFIEWLVKSDKLPHSENRHATKRYKNEGAYPSYCTTERI
jgi:hypothetical protein